MKFVLPVVCFVLVTCGCDSPKANLRAYEGDGSPQALCNQPDRFLIEFSSMQIGERSSERVFSVRKAVWIPNAIVGFITPEEAHADQLQAAMAGTFMNVAIARNAQTNKDEDVLYAMGGEWKDLQLVTVCFNGTRRRALVQSQNFRRFLNLQKGQTIDLVVNISCFPTQREDTAHETVPLEIIPILVSSDAVEPSGP
jgi:hypothetical protein